MNICGIIYYGNGDILEGVKYDDEIKGICSFFLNQWNHNLLI